MASSINELNARLPVTLKTTTPFSGYHINQPSSNPLNSHPGPALIYPAAALNLIQVPERPASHYMQATRPPSQITPLNTYLPPTTTKATSKPSNLYLPALKPETLTNLSSVYLPASIYLPPKAPANFYVTSQPSKPPPKISNDILPPKQPEAEDCENSQGNLVIAIPLKTRDNENSCGQVAKLILPIKSLDSYSINKLKSTVPNEIDATQLIKNVLENLL